MVRDYKRDLDTRIDLYTGLLLKNNERVDLQRPSLKDLDQKRRIYKSISNSGSNN